MFSQRVKISFIAFALISLQIGFSYADVVSIKERKKQLIAEEHLVHENEKNENFIIDKNAKLEDYIRIGLKNNPGLRAGFYKWKVSFKKISKEASLADPQFTFTEYLEEVETRVG